MMKRIYVLIFIMQGSLLLGQNLREFSPNMNRFPGEVLYYLTYSDELQPEEATIVQEFKNYWDSVVFTIDEKDKIMVVSNMLLAKKVSPRPQFYNFVHLLTQFKRTQHDPRSFSNWLDCFEKYVADKKTTTAGIDRIVKITLDIIEKEALSIFPAGQWISRSKQYRFEESNRRFLVVIDKTDLVGYNLKRDSIEIKDTRGKLDLLEIQ